MQSDLILWLALLYLLKRSGCFSTAELFCFFGMIFSRNLSLTDGCCNTQCGNCCNSN